MTKRIMATKIGEFMYDDGQEPKHLNQRSKAPYMRPTMSIWRISIG